MFKLARSRPIAAAFRAATVRFLSFAQTFESYNSTLIDIGLAHRSLPFNLAFASNRETCRSMNICPRSSSSRYEQPDALDFPPPPSRRTNRSDTQYGVGMPKGEVAYSAEEAEAVAKSLGMV
ncbi:unnamed protein product [Aspergillus oryzae]|uniref:Unnamed protein product n=1 Tax=Aspergillus oryzae var. brunneus TaxID=332754 RepID=A0ABQ6LB90_ASPOZ|nr:unnamed protein product [Aspergillus oryzae]GMG10198.1 unnamed protein product [Aspergillus oryzae]GMG51981.1 unnamed protein product [Aspergillus oryzae var. brunneus]